MPFDRPSLATLIERIDADLAANVTADELPYSDRKVLARALAGAAHGFYGHLDWQSRQIIPDTAEAEFLLRWATIFGRERKAAVAATGSVDFTGTDNTTIPAGTALQRDDGTEFTTDALATIAGGTATAAVTASEGGADGNTDAAETLTLVSPISGVDAEATVAAGGLTGGADEESDAALLSRLLLRIQLGAPNGKPGDYEQWALQIAGVTRAWDYAAYTGLGTVGVTFVLDNDDMDATILPDGAKVTEVQDYIDTVRPQPASVTVFAPTAKALNFDIQLTPNTAAVQAAVEEELKDLLRRHAEPGGTVLLSRINEAVSLAEGETDHVLNAPAANVTHQAGEIAVMGTITWS